LKKNLLLALMICVIMAFTGCAGSGSSTTDSTSLLSSEDLAAVEASLIVDRTLAASVLNDTDGNILASIGTGEGMFRYRNRQYSSQINASGLGINRGTGTCMATISGDHLSIGTEQCSLEKLETGEIVITRGNGSVITIPAPDNIGEVRNFTLGEIIWEATYGNDPGAPLVELKNTRSGIKLSISENDDGTLTIVRDLSEVFSGRWAEDGNLELADSLGKRYRYRYGQSN